MKKFSLLILILYGWYSTLASQSNQYDIPLSSPGEAGLLEIDVYNAGIEVEGYEGAVVQLSIQDKRTKKGRRTPEFLYDIIEKDNHVSIIAKERPRIKGIQLVLKVPRNFSTKLTTYWGPAIEVRGLQGEVEANGHFTDLQLFDLRENVVATTKEGRIQARFQKLKADSIIFVSNYNGNTEVSFPRSTKATLLLDNFFGKYDSDFKLTLDTRPDKKNASKFIHRLLNGGGPEVKLINYFGNINIKSL